MSKTKLDNVEEKKVPSFSSVIFVFLYLIVTMGISVLWLEIPIHITLVSAAIVTTIVAMMQGYSWEEIQAAILHGCSIAMLPMLILMIIGAIIGAWISAGTIQTIIYYGLQLISPRWFLVAAALMCSITSLATGSAWTTSGTIGVALMGIGAGLGVPAGMTAGAVVSGSYFGDKMSPLSDSTNLAAAVAEADLFEHIKHMIYTVGPGLALSLLAYAVLGARFGGETLDPQQMAVINETLTGLNQNFNLSLWLLIPPVAVIIMAVKKVPALASLIISALMGGVFALIFQGASIHEITQAMNWGFVSETGIESVDALLSRGGMQSMMWTVSLGFIALSFGGILEKTYMLEVILNKIEPLIKTTGSLVLTTLLGSLATNFSMASQYMAIIIPGRMLAPAYKRLNLKTKNLSRALEDGGTVFAPLVPWSLSGAFSAGVLGISTIEYVPYAFLCFFVPVISAIYGMTGFTMEYEDENQDKIDNNSETKAK
ncbi:Na+/H+ antiporter NhaC [Halanaerobium praevalens]|uniref:Transporter, NhaC family n=1 Tax=Halanaerobium praevalens (strain ATCC 33744 / DSM 2228 / GSL) TaxID=572479 RepID=E3DP53_HALPG|nr:Na+/H+ antiporter NhaC [Halanaerobium praevalens]ADO77686.1 transporter, NhaC family [Halanaerobium praevalens DSM 2228]